MAFGFHVFISITLLFLFFLAHRGSNACNWCLVPVGIWNSVSMVVGLFIGSHIPVTAPFYMYKIANLVLYPLYLLTPLLFGVSGGYARLYELGHPRRFLKAFTLLYFPVWLPASIVTILWLGFGILIV